MARDLARIEVRKKIIQDMGTSENKSRKAESFKQCEIYSDRLHQYVSERLREFNSEATVREIPVIASINLSRRIVKEEASIYKDSPLRTFSDVSDKQSDVIKLIYKDMKADTKLCKSNEFYKLQSQGMLQIIPKKGKLVMKVLKMHHFDAVPDLMNPEEAEIIIISGMDRQELKENYRERTATGFEGKADTNRSANSDGVNQVTGDPDDSQAMRKRLVWWSEKFHFMTNGMGDIIDENGEPLKEINEEDIINPVGVLPFVDIATTKDFEYFVREGGMSTEFTIDYNSILSEIEQVMRMQGFSVGVLKGPADLMPENLVIGPNNILRLITDTEAGADDVSFEYASPSADIPGAISLAEFVLAAYLSSRGIDPTTISGRPQADKKSSGLERLLAMIERLEATKEDFNVYDEVEDEIYKLISSWHNALIGTNTLNPKYMTTKINEESEVVTQFSRPEMVQTQKEQTELWSLKIDEGLATRVDAIMDLEGIDNRKAAMERIKQIEEEGKEIGELISPEEDEAPPENALIPGDAMFELKEGIKEEDADPEE